MYLDIIMFIYEDIWVIHNEKWIYKLTWNIFQSKLKLVLCQISPNYIFTGLSHKRKHADILRNKTKVISSNYQNNWIEVFTKLHMKFSFEL